MTHGQDMTIKLIEEDHRPSLLKKLKIEDIKPDAKIEPVPREMVKITPSIMRPDIIVRIGKTLIMIEHQSTKVDLDDKSRFDSYICEFSRAIIKKHRGKIDEIHFYILSTAEETKTVIYHRLDGVNVPLKIVSLADSNKEEIINSIKQKHENNESFSDGELIDFALTPLMETGREKITEQFKKNYNLIINLNYPNEEIKNTVYGITLLLVNMYFDVSDPFRRKITGDLMNYVDSIDEFGYERYNEGINEGRIEERLSLIKTLLNDGEITVQSAVKRLVDFEYETADIQKATGLSKAQIENIKNQE